MSYLKTIWILQDYFSTKNWNGIQFQCTLFFFHILNRFHDSVMIFKGPTSIIASWLIYAIIAIGDFQPSKSAKIHGNQNSEPLNVLNCHFWHFYNPQNPFHVKSEPLKNSTIMQLCMTFSGKILVSISYKFIFWEIQEVQNLPFQHI